MEGTVSGCSVYTVSPRRNRYLMSRPAPPLSAPPGCWETGSLPAMSHVWQVPFMLAERNPVILKVMFLGKKHVFRSLYTRNGSTVNENWPQRTKTHLLCIFFVCGIPCRKPVVFLLGASSIWGGENASDPNIRSNNRPRASNFPLGTSTVVVVVDVVDALSRKRHPVV